MKILYIWDADYPWDVRVEKISHALMAGGHELHVAARNLKKRPAYENIAGLHVHRIKTWSSDRFNYFASFPLFCSPVWKGFLDSIIRERGIDLVIVRDLPMAIAGIWAGKRAGIPVIFDMAEDYVSLVRDIWHARKFQGLNLVVRNPYLAKLVERYTFKHIDQILVVVEEAGEVVTQGGGAADKITLVGNTPDPKGLGGATGAELDETLQTIRNHYSAIYTGGIQLGRGLQVVFDAIPEIVRHIPDFKFVVVGDGYASDTLKRMMREKGIEQHVAWVGWVKHTELPRYLNACRVGIVPHYTSDHVNTTIPNKIFDYMGSGLPVLASDAKPMKRILEQEKCGGTFPSGNASELTKTLLAMRGHEEELGANGRRAVLEKYNWHEDTKRLLQLVARLESKQR
jgi:glycosyltransferase involved in cell wall biosynthesis